MTSPSEATLTAARLRTGDVLPAHGPHAQVVRPPVISTDGSMVTVLLADAETPGQAAETATPRLLRIPVDQPVTVHRPRSAEGDRFVRSARVARSSGARILVLNLTHPDSDVTPLEGNRYATLCVSHHALRFHQRASTAEALASHPEEWCPGCRDTTATRAQDRVYGAGQRRPA